MASTRGSCQNKRLNTEHSVQQAARCPVWDSHLFLSPGQNDSGSSLHVGSDLIFTISTCFGGRVGPGEGGWCPIGSVLSSRAPTSGHTQSVRLIFIPGVSGWFPFGRRVSEAPFKEPVKAPSVARGQGASFILKVSSVFLNYSHQHPPIHTHILTHKQDSCVPHVLQYNKPFEPLFPSSVSLYMFS